MGNNKTKYNVWKGKKKKPKLCYLYIYHSSEPRVNKTMEKRLMAKFDKDIQKQRPSKGKSSMWAILKNGEVKDFFY